MNNTTDIDYNDLSLNQNNPTAINIDYNSTKESCNLTSVIPEEGYLWPYAAFPIFITSLILGQLIRSYHNFLPPNEIKISELLDISITHNLQA